MGRCTGDLEKQLLPLTKHQHGLPPGRWCWACIADLSELHQAQQASRAEHASKLLSMQPGQTSLHLHPS